MIPAPILDFWRRLQFLFSSEPLPKNSPKIPAVRAVGYLRKPFGSGENPRPDTTTAKPAADLPVRERQIFFYWDGTHQRAIDPMVAYRGLMTHDKFNAQVHPDLAAEGDLESLQIIVGAVRDVFGVSPFRSSFQNKLGDTLPSDGLTESETADIMRQFLDYCGNVKKNGNPPPISPESTDSKSSIPSVAPATNASLASGSILPELRDDDLWEC